MREPVDGAFVAKLARHAASEFPATCAIMGGVVGAEVIKIIGTAQLHPPAPPYTPLYPPLTPLYPPPNPPPLHPPYPPLLTPSSYLPPPVPHPPTPPPTPEVIKIIRSR